MITSLLRQNDATTSFWCNNYRIFTPWARWVEFLMGSGVTHDDP